MSQQLLDHYNNASDALRPHYQKVQPYLSKAHKKAEPYLAPIDKELARFPSLNKLEQTTGLPKAYLGVGVFLLFVTFIFFNVFAKLLTNAIGFVGPAYFSLKALQSQTPGDDSQVQYLTYWSVYGFFSMIEGFADHIVYWFPFYYTFKAVFLIWLQLPQTQGAKLIYANILRPTFFKTPKGQLPRGYYSGNSTTSTPSDTTAATSGLSSALRGTFPGQTTTGFPTVRSAAPTTNSLNRDDTPTTTTLPTNLGSTTQQSDSYARSPRSSEAIHAAQTAKALNGVEGQIPSTLQPAVDAIARGDFSQARARNPFQ